MPTILSDPPQWLYILLALGVLLPLGMAFFFPANAPAAKDGKNKKSSSRKLYFFVSGIALLLLVAFFVCDKLNESDREQIERKMQEMSDGVRERNLDKVFRNVSESFRVGSADKAALRRLAESAQQSHQVDELKVWDLSLEPMTEPNKATLRFQFKVEGTFGQGQFYRAKGYFVKDADGQWRLQRFEVFNPAADSNSPLPIPGL